MHCVVLSVKEIPRSKEIALKYAAKYFGTVVEQVNVSEEAHDKQRNNTRTVLIKVTRLKNNRATKIDPRLSLFLFHKIAHIYRDTPKQETVQTLLLIQGLHVNFGSTKAVGTSPETPIISMSLQPTIPMEPTLVTAVIEDLKDIQTHTPQVWNYDKIAFYPNVS